MAITNAVYYSRIVAVKSAESICAANEYLKIKNSIVATKSIPNSSISLLFDIDMIFLFHSLDIRIFS
jgi:hypothetical protein